MTNEDLKARLRSPGIGAMWGPSPFEAAADAIERLEAENARLRDLLCLADAVLMEAIGAFPLPGNVLREACIKIRDETGPDYHHRKDRARAALQETSHDRD